MEKRVVPDGKVLLADPTNPEGTVEVWVRGGVIDAPGTLYHGHTVQGWSDVDWGGPHAPAPFLISCRTATPEEKARWGGNVVYEAAPQAAQPRGAFFRSAFERSMPDLQRIVAAAVAEAMRPPPDGMVKVNLSLVLAEELLADEVALGHFLVRHVKEKLNVR